MTSRDSVVRIGALLPDIMSTYGDDGNALVLRQRLQWRGYQTDIVPITLQDAVPESCDIYTLGGGEDVAQILGARHLRSSRGLFAAVESGSPLLAVCAGLQMLGDWFQVADGSHAEGVGLLDITTQPQAERSIGELTATPLLPQLTQELTGFENHMGATVLGADARPLSRVPYWCGQQCARRGGGALRRICGWRRAGQHYRHLYAWAVPGAQPGTCRLSAGPSAGCGAW